MSNTPSAKSREEILKEQQIIVAKKYSLGSQLVIGHRPTYWDEAALATIKIREEAAVDEALRQAAENAKVGVKYFHEFNRDTFVDKDSILSLRSQILENLK